MTSDMIQSKDELPIVLSILAEFYKYPDEDFYQEVVSRNVDKELTSLFSKLDIHIKTEFKLICPPHKELQTQFMHLFSGILKPFAPPIESVYKIWTTDPSAKVAIAKSKGYLMGDAALHMQHLYKQFQIEVPSGYENTPDHLTLQLEFLAYLYETSNIEASKQFVNEHLDWLDDFINELEKLEGSSFYLHATRIVRSVLQNIK